FCGTDSNENNAEKWAGAEINISPTKGTAKVPGLQNGTPYYLWVRAVLTTGDGFFIPGEFLLLNTNDASPVTPNNGNAGITLNLDPIPTAEDTDYNLTNNLALDHLNLLENTSLTINIPVAISNYEWFIDGIKAVNVTGLVSGVGTKNLTVYARYFTAGPRPNGVQHTISARIQINGNWYSKNVVFTVYAAP
ncbi:MAG: fibronectin type III domain-containing protein, partial [Treponema sp.]|nr:fibronectin type III domain-containing protein [Treponema sp.]